MAREMIRARFSQAPVCGTDRDDLLGIVHARDILAEMLKGKKTFPVRKLLKKPYFIPLERSAENVMRDLQIRKIRMAIVVDEFGGIEGLVTLDDILDTLAGDIFGAGGEQEKGFHRVDGRTWVVSGQTDLESFNRKMGTSLPEEDYETIGGFVFHLFGKLPGRGDEIRHGPLVFTVEKTGRTRILRIRVRKEGEGAPGG